MVCNDSTIWEEKYLLRTTWAIMDPLLRTTWRLWALALVEGKKWNTKSTFRSLYWGALYYSPSQSAYSIWMNQFQIGGSLWRKVETSNSECITRIPKVLLTNLFHWVELIVTWVWRKVKLCVKKLENVSLKAPFISTFTLNFTVQILYPSDVFEFDNSFSYLRTKKLRYLIAIDLPISSEEDFKWTLNNLSSFD